jgi:poly(hydroxyalkanoate) depolymerase family esterase
MRGLGKIVSRMNAMRSSLEAANLNDAGRLDDLTGFGTNPGELDCRIFVPNAKPSGLVVVLHGCTQNASVYDQGSGWTKLAERHGFAVLYPQQRRANNPNLCFNWYVPADARRDCGEAQSINQMVKHTANRFGLDRSRTFVTGLSAGGAMTAVMLACYPELFAGGAIIAGLPFATASTLPHALARMRGQGTPHRRELAARARAAAPIGGSAPSLSVWHGTADTVVDPANATALVHQWRDLHGLGEVEGRVDTVSGHRREVWVDREGRSVVERYDIRGMGHGTPLNVQDSEACGRAGPHMLDAGICSTRHIATLWGLTALSADVLRKDAPARDRAEPVGAQTPPQALPASSNVGEIIENALRSAGLMR